MAKQRPSLGVLIAERRRALGLTQLALSQQVGVSESTVRNWESRGTRPAKRNLRALAAALQLPQELLELNDAVMAVTDPADDHAPSLRSLLRGTSLSPPQAAVSAAALQPDLMVRIGDHVIVAETLRVVTWDIQPASAEDSATVLERFADALDEFAADRGWKVRARRADT